MSYSSVMESNRQRTRRRRTKQEEMVREAIWSSIRGHSCPICFRNLEDHYREVAILSVCMHAYCIECIRKWSGLKRKCPLCNANFSSWFCKLSLSSGEFHKEVLPFEGLTRNSHRESVSARTAAPRLIRRTRVALDERRTRALPWRRSFGRPGHASPEVAAQRKLDWRASIYKKHLKAVPLSSSYLEQIKSRNSFSREKTLQKIEPWIRRELQAVLGDPDPTVIVHVATSQYLAWLEERVSSGQLDVEERFISPLRPFLQDKARIFWHELRCYAEGCYNIETYDAVVGYRDLE
ncbi:E3 ubiquitin-protein ligase Topors [Neltuma alba]|uniref:E3 ubiquitin-protein ligase Topors n=1 Tax=Neltuma alba TaxID=207710 RepID=UPI0010A44862|nr:E3 ubiquitin-protein ligase Topors-like [Prosopis alba]